MPTDYDCSNRETNTDGRTNFQSRWIGTDRTDRMVVLAIRIRLVAARCRARVCKSMLDKEGAGRPNESNGWLKPITDQSVVTMLIGCS